MSRYSGRLQVRLVLCTAAVCGLISSRVFGGGDSTAMVLCILAGEGILAAALSVGGRARRQDRGNR
jgi:hypothetical protein